MSGEKVCGCDLVTEGVAQWWIDLPGLHHLTGCPMRPTPVPSEDAETTAGEREALVRALADWTRPNAIADDVLTSDWLAALLDRVRREEGERIAQAIERRARNGGPLTVDGAASIARAASVGRGEWQ